MATNLRLRQETEHALREAALESGRSQQDLIREAIDRYLGLGAPADRLVGSIEQLIAQGKVIPPRAPYRRAVPTFLPTDGLRSEDLLERDDRF